MLICRMLTPRTLAHRLATEGWTADRRRTAGGRGAAPEAAARTGTDRTADGPTAAKRRGPGRPGD